MIVDKDVPIPMSDGNTLYCNVFRPEAAGPHPVVMSFGVYGKDIHFEDGFNPQWTKLKNLYPEIDRDGSTGHFLRWEVPDPERWVPDGFIIIVVDGRGSGKSPGFLDVFSPQETRDYYECIEWAGTQPWSNGRVGLLGISYLAIKQWQVAALRPPHLAAMVPWEGCCDYYRDSQRHGGILSNTFNTAWWPRQILINQHGNGDTTHIDRDTGGPTTGRPLSPAELEGNRSEHPAECRRHPIWDEWHQDRSARLERIEVPLLSAANWGGPGMHLRGNFEGWMRAGSKDKWLFAHIGTHYESFYLPRYVAIQKRFFAHYLKGEDNGWDREPHVQLAIRQPDGSAVMRAEHEWPLARTRWTPWYLGADESLSTIRPAKDGAIEYAALGDGVTFSSAPFPEDVEFTGPVVAKLWVSSSTADMDLFVALRLVDAEGRETVITGAHEEVPVAMGWLRASHRRLDSEKSHPWRPWHSHDQIEPLIPGERYEVEVEILPTSMVYRKGCRLLLTVRGRDFIVTQPGRIRHDDPDDRPEARFGGTCTIHTGPTCPSHLLMPVIPMRD